MIKNKGLAQTLAFAAALWVWCAPQSFAQNATIESKQETIARAQARLDSVENDRDRFFLTKDLFYVYVNDDLLAAEKSVMQSIEYASNIEDVQLLATSYIDLGNIYTSTGNYDLALEQLEKAHTYIDQLRPSIQNIPENWYLDAILNFYEGKAYLELSLYDLAEYHIKIAETKFKPNIRNTWLAQYELAKIELYRGNIDELAEKIILLDAAIPETNNQVNPDYFYHYIVLAELYTQIGEFEKANNIINRIYDLVQIHGRNFYLGIMHFTLSEIELNAGALKKAEEHSLKAHDYFRKQGEFNYYMKTLLQISEVYSSLEDYEKSYAYLNEYQQKLTDIQEKQHTAISSYLHTSESKTKEVESLLIEKDLQLNQRRTLIFALVILCIGVCVISVLVWKSSQDKKKVTDELVNLNLDKNHFIGVVSHDLRSPLNSVMVLAEFMRDDPELMDEATAKEYGNIIFNSTQQMQHLLNNMLDVNKIETKITKIENSSIELLPIVKSQYETISILGKTKGIDTKLSMHVESATVIGNENAIVRILENLISNAYKFSSADSTVTIGVQNAGRQTEISVSDEGPGLTELDKTKLFKKFEKLSASPTGNEKSTGLGLYIVKNLVQQMNGTILIESEQGKGTTFKILLNNA